MYISSDLSTASTTSDLVGTHANSCSNQSLCLHYVPIVAQKFATFLGVLVPLCKEQETKSWVFIFFLNHYIILIGWLLIIIIINLN